MSTRVVRRRETKQRRRPFHLTVLIRAEWRETPKGRRAKVYSLTAAGRKQLAEQRESWARFAGALGAILETT